MQKVHFRLTWAAQKRCCLNSPVTVPEAFAKSKLDPVSLSFLKWRMFRMFSCFTFFPSNLQDVTSAIVSSCAHFFSVMLPSSSLLILDFIKATDGIIISQNMEVIVCTLFQWLNILFCVQRWSCLLLSHTRTQRRNGGSSLPVALQLFRTSNLTGLMCTEDGELL